MGNRVAVVMIALFFKSSPVVAAEVDQFTRRNEALNDASALIHQKAEALLDRALVSANRVGRCDESALYDEMRVYFRNHKGELLRYMLEDQDFPRRNLLLKDTIYADWTLWDGRLLGRRGADTSPVALGAVMRFGEHVIGSDKFEHLFGRGYAYFDRYYLRGHSIERVLRFGVRGEASIYGGTKLATGVFSYADLTANLNGLRFWNQVLALRSDILDPSFRPGPYVHCASGQWVKAKPIDFSVYIDAGWDESINCSRFPTEATAAKVIHRVKKLEAIDPDHRYQCPVDPSLLPGLQEKYGKYSDWVINTEGHTRKKPTARFRTQAPN